MKVGWPLDALYLARHCCQRRRDSTEPTVLNDRIVIHNPTIRFRRTIPQKLRLFRGTVGDGLLSSLHWYFSTEQPFSSSPCSLRCDPGIHNVFTATARQPRVFVSERALRPTTPDDGDRPTSVRRQHLPKLYKHRFETRYRWLPLSLTLSIRRWTNR